MAGTRNPGLDCETYDRLLTGDQMDFSAKLDTLEQQQSKWAQLKAEQHARMQDLLTKMEQRNAQLDAAGAEGNANWAESEAADAIDFAAWAIDNARVSVLYAIDTRVTAYERAAAVRA